MSASWPPDIDVLSVIDEWAHAQRWFPADPGASLELLDNLDVSAYSAPPDWDGGTALDPVWISWIRVGSQTIQVPLVYTDTAPPGGLGVIARVRDAWLVDGVLHPSFLRAWIRAAAAAGTLGEGIADPAALEASLLARADDARPVTGEQSNSSIVIPPPADGAGGAGADVLRSGVILKCLRAVMPGIHPDLEEPLALAGRGWAHVPPPLAHLELPVPLPGAGDGSARRTEQAVSGIASVLVEGARDGFEFFVDLARAGEDPTGPARELGDLTAQMHRHLADAFGLGGPPSAAELACRIRSNLEAAAAEVHALSGDLLGRLEDAVAPLEQIGELPPAIRIHGDYHLGQTLRGGDGRWYIVDFEGEPLRSLEERRRPDLAVRDVAGMLRSFDYASAQAARHAPRGRAMAASTAELPVITAGTAPSGSGDPEWSRAAQASFIAGYTDDHGFDGGLLVLVRALMIEKAAYEVVYEHRLRPSWLPIPMAALGALAGPA